MAARIDENRIRDLITAARQDRLDEVYGQDLPAAALLTLGRIKQLLAHHTQLRAQLGRMSDEIQQLTNTLRRDLLEG